MINMRGSTYVLADEGSEHFLGHFCLNVDAYTYFTSPNRRYADVSPHLRGTLKTLHSNVGTRTPLLEASLAQRWRKDRGPVRGAN